MANSACRFLKVIRFPLISKQHKITGLFNGNKWFIYDNLKICQCSCTYSKNKYYFTKSKASHWMGIFISSPNTDSFDLVTQQQEICKYIWKRSGLMKLMPQIWMQSHWNQLLHSHSVCGPHPVYTQTCLVNLFILFKVLSETFPSSSDRCCRSCFSSLQSHSNGFQLVTSVLAVCLIFRENKMSVSSSRWLNQV